ncbi:MAG: hypothetical protein R3B13_15440 [Polyangiaceae bacterium]
MRFVIGSGLLVALVGCVGLTGCGDEFTCEEAGNCASGTGSTSGTGGTGATGGAGGTDGGAGIGGSSGSGGDGGGCDTNAAPGTEACLVDEQYAVFVSASGSDAADGSKGTPFATIEKGMETAKAAGKIVIACNAPFTEGVSIGTAHEGVNVYGGFNCSTWAYEPTIKTSVAPAKGYALQVDGVTTATSFTGFEFKAADGVADGESSIAAFVKNSSALRFESVDFVAGAGKNGKNGVRTDFVYEALQSKLNGNDATGAAAGGPKTCLCPAGDSTIGGAGGFEDQGGSPGKPQGSANGGTLAACKSTNTGGGVGDNGVAQGDAPGAASVGTLSNSGFAGSSGDNGKDGPAGQAGGGGAGATGPDTGLGGGGGCGGCGGAGGPGGGAGGSSIALLVFDSTVTATSCTFTTGDAGDGGTGDKGQAGATQVGFGGGKTNGGCTGGKGGSGGAGGNGGGGAGGVSVGILHSSGSTINDTSSMFTTGKAGNAGNGGGSGNNGVAGEKQDKLAL